MLTILRTQEYCGDVINFKTYSKSFKLKKRIENTKENMAIFKDVHEAIIDRGDWEKVQQKAGKRVRKTSTGEKNIFSGYLVCSNCGNTLHYHVNSVSEIQYFSCAYYKGNRRGDCETTHYIRVDFLEQVLLWEIRRVAQFAKRHGDEFMKAAIGLSQQTAQTERQRKQRELNALIARDKELDKLFTRIYEDNVAGKIDDDRFGRMSRQYTEEQQSITQRIKEYRAELETQDCQSITAETFMARISQYTRVKKLTHYMLSELIKRIEVYHPEKIDGVWRQKLRIHYHGLGVLVVPDTTQIPACEVTMQTRKGVAVTYSSQQDAVA